MPRPRKGPHLYLKRREQFGRKSVWVIRDGANDKSTGCGEGELEAAEKALQAYIAGKYTPPKAADCLEAIPIADVLNVYLTEHAPTVARPDFIVAAIVLCGLLILAVTFMLQAWTRIEAQMSVHGWIALALGVVLSLAIGLGLMALVFFSARRGHDDAAGGEERE
jgi:hypothetical protein